MKNKKPSIDGFIPRRIGGELGELHGGVRPSLGTEVVGRSIHTGEEEQEMVGKARPGQSIGRSDIDESLREIDSDTTAPKRLSRRQRRRLKRQSKPRSKLKRVMKWSLITVLIVILGLGAYLGVKLMLAGGGIFKGSIFDLIQSQPLKEDENGRSNFLVFGTESEDHPGANLTDSIMVLSINQDQKNAYMISLPRDLWVEYPQQCWVGDQGKINAAYTCASNDGEDERAGTEALQSVVSNVTGLDIHYYVHANWNAVVEGVDAIGGIDITIESDDPRGILDRNFDWVCNYNCYYVNYKNGERVHLDGEHALALARARNAQGGYGISDNFGRERNQQAIIRALLDKTVSAGTLTNLGAVTGLIDTFGNNLRTNIETKEIRTLMGLGMDISQDNIKSLSLVDENEPLVTTGGYNEQSIVRPIRGLLDYTDIQAYIDRNLSNDPATRENASIVVLNGSGVVGAGQTTADKLKANGFIIGLVGNAPTGTYAPVELYIVDSSKTATLDKIKAQYPDLVIKTTTPPIEVNDSKVGFVLIIGPTGQ